MTLAKRAEQARSALFERYDQINTLWSEAEESLTRLHIPQPVLVSCWMDEEYYQHQPTGSGVEHLLGMQRVKGKWRICYSSYYSPNEQDEELSWSPITECSADIRIRTAQYVEKLREKIVESAENFIANADEAILVLRAAVKMAKSEETATVLSDRAKRNGKA